MTYILSGHSYGNNRLPSSFVRLLMRSSGNTWYTFEFHVHVGAGDLNVLAILLCSEHSVPCASVDYVSTGSRGYEPNRRKQTGVLEKAKGHLKSYQPKSVKNDRCSNFREWTSWLFW